MYGIASIHPSTNPPINQQIMQNRITKLFKNKSQDVLNVYFTAGYPELHDTANIIKTLADNGADMIEIGIPFSDPIADGPTIQHSNQIALNNGISLEILFEQLEGIRDYVDIPLLLMGYLNPVIQYGVEAFCKKAAEIGIDGLILPDLPMFEFENTYQKLFEVHQLSLIFLISPQTSEQRIRKIDNLSNGFIYVVSTDSTTGKTNALSQAQENYFNRIKSMQLKNPFLIGFGISDHKSFKTASSYANGAIIGSAFIKAIGKKGDLNEKIRAFIGNIRATKIKN